MSRDVLGESDIETESIQIEISGREAKWENWIENQEDLVKELREAQAGGRYVRRLQEQVEGKRAGRR